MGIKASAQYTITEINEESEKEVKSESDIIDEMVNPVVEQIETNTNKESEKDDEVTKESPEFGDIDDNYQDFCESVFEDLNIDLALDI